MRRKLCECARPVRRLENTYAALARAFLGYPNLLTDRLAFRTALNDQRVSAGVHRGAEMEAAIRLCSRECEEERARLFRESSGVDPCSANREGAVNEQFSAGDGGELSTRGCEVAANTRRAHCSHAHVRREARSTRRGSPPTDRPTRAEGSGALRWAGEVMPRPDEGDAGVILKSTVRSSATRRKSS